MPNAKVLSEKQATVAALAEKMKNATSGVLVDYKGITVEDDTKLRSELRKANVDYAVVKNTLVRLAANQIGFESHDKFFQIKAGFLEGKVVDLATVESLAAIPPKDILLSTVLGTMMAPVAALARVLQAIADKQGEEAAPAASEAEAQA